MKRVLLPLAIVAVAALATIFYLKHKVSATRPQTGPVYHGGACDDPTYYNSHLRICSVQ